MSYTMTQHGGAEHGFSKAQHGTPSVLWETNALHESLCSMMTQETLLTGDI